MRPDKQRDLLEGALRVFARDGYSRASIDALAAEAGVSTRTIYNHYGDKAGLFRAVILDSATRVAGHETGLAERHLARMVDLREDLVAFGVAWASSASVTATHFAMVRQVRADIAHIDPATIEAWQEAGPRRVRRALAGHLARMSQAGLLRVEDPSMAALHLVQLTVGCAGDPPAGDTVEAVVRAGIDVFLAAYGA